MLLLGSIHALVIPTLSLQSVMIANGFVHSPPASTCSRSSHYRQCRLGGHGIVTSNTIENPGNTLFTSSLRPLFHSSGSSSCRKNSKGRGKRNYLKFIKDFRTKSKHLAGDVNSAASSKLMTMTLPYTDGEPSPIRSLQNMFSRILDMNEVSKWRMAAATFIMSIAVFRPKIDLALVQFWSWLQTDTTALLPRLFRHDHWEWMVAIWAFFFWIHGYWLVDRSIAKSDVKMGPVHPWKKYRLQDEYEAEKLRRKQVQAMKLESTTTATSSLSRGGGGKTAVSGTPQHQHQFEQKQAPPPTKQNKWHTGFWIFELPLYVLPLYIWDITIPRRAAKIATWGAPTTFKVCKDVTCGLLLYDIGFFVCHYLMHKVPILYKYVHAKHHTAKEVRASDIVRLSFVEEIVDVGISILALNYMGAHPISRTIYNVIITFLLTELHSGYAFPWTPQFVVPFGLATGSKGHHYHHRNGRHYYQKFFCHVDRLFGFVQKKDDSLQGASI